MPAMSVVTRLFAADYIFYIFYDNIYRLTLFQTLFKTASAEALW